MKTKIWVLLILLWTGTQKECGKEQLEISVTSWGGVKLIERNSNFYKGTDRRDNSTGRRGGVLLDTRKTKIGDRWSFTFHRLVCLLKRGQ